MASQPGFLEAVARARQVAEKMQQQKRSLDSTNDDDGVKKPRADGSLGFAAQSYSSPTSNSQSASESGSNQGPIDPLQKVKEVAARLNQQVAVMKGAPPMMLDGNGVQDEFWVPERLVGLVIGKGGETISRLQAESGAHMQVDQLSNGGPERRCMLSGPKDAVERIKNMLRQLVERGKTAPGSGLPAGQIVEEVLIPGNLVGIVIGKGGEQIKQIQEQCGVKMVLIQDTHEVSQSGKPLRITGDAERVRNAKDVVLRILAQKEEQDKGKMGGAGRGRGRGGGFPPPLFGQGGVGEYGTPQDGAVSGGGGSYSSAGSYRSTRVEVPNSIVGGVIGKSGEMIRRISQDFGSVKMQFANDADPSTGMKVLEIGPGPAQAVDDCANCVRKLVDIMQSAKNSGGRQSTDALTLYQQIRQDQPGGSYGQATLAGYSGPDPTKLSPYEQTEIFFPIPFRKAGYVIGKGGATIHEIIRESGAHVEVLRDVNEKELMASGQQPESKTFRIKGMVSQIESALRIITTKAGVPPPPGWCTQPQDLASLYAYSLASSGTTDAAAAAVAAAAASAVDPMASYWYQQMYQQQQQPQSAGAYPTGQGSQAPTDPSQTAASGYPSPSINPSTGQADYSEAWAQYYRSLGQHEYADMILAQAHGQQPGQDGSSAPQPANAGGSQQQQQQAQSTAYPGYQQPGQQQQYMQQAQPQGPGSNGSQQH